MTEQQKSYETRIENLIFRFEKEKQDIRDSILEYKHVSILIFFDFIINRLLKKSLKFVNLLHMC